MRRWLSLTLTAALIFTSSISPAWAALPASAPVARRGVVPPAALGFLTDTHQAGSDRKIILIQDLHAHYETQQKIAGLLKFYESKGLLKGPVAIEGASGLWDLSPLESYPANAGRSEFFDYLLQEAGLTGPEWFALETHRPQLLWGVDSAPDFTAQRQLFNKTRLAREIAAKQMEEVQRSLHFLAAHDFKGRLKKWKILSDQFDRGELYGDVYLKKLLSLGSNARLPREAVSLQKMLWAKSAGDAAELAVSDKFYSDLRKYGQAVGLALARTPGQANLIKASYSADLVKRLLQQQLTLEEIRQIASRQQDTAELIGDLLKGSGQASWFDAAVLLELVRASTDFYVAALVRDEPMAQQAARLADQNPTVVLIAGGFHTRGITRELKRLGISYDVIVPAITAEYTAEDHSRYADRLAGRPVDLQTFFAPGGIRRSVKEEPAGSRAHTLAALLKPSQKLPDTVSLFREVPAFQVWARFFEQERAASKSMAESVQRLGYVPMGAEGPSHVKMIARDKKGQFDAPKGSLYPLFKAIRERERLLGAKAVEGHGRIDRIHILMGHSEALPELSGSYTVEDLDGVLVVREEIAPGHYALWINENTLAPVMPYLQGPRSTSASRAMVVDALLRHEHAEGHTDVSIKTVARRSTLASVLGRLVPGRYRRLQEVPVTHQDLIKYGATFDRLAQSLITGEPTPHIRQFMQDASLDWGELQRVMSFNETVRRVSQAEDGPFEQELDAMNRVVQTFSGFGLNEADAYLMGLFYGSSQPGVKNRLLKIRGLLFAQGEAYVRQGMQELAGLMPDAAVDPAAGVTAQLRATLQRWRQFALAYAASYLKDNPQADEQNMEAVGKSVVDEIEQDIFQPLFSSTDEIDRLAAAGETQPDKVRLRLSRSSPEGHVSIRGRSARVGFLPMKGDPWQIGHIFTMVSAIAAGRLDKVVIMVDNGDPDRKPDLSSLAIREPMTLALLKLLEPFIEYTAISKEEEDLKIADGERSIFRLMSLNRGLPIEWFYMGGSDHRRWEVIKEGKPPAPDTAKKLHDYMKAGTDGYAGEPMGLIFMERSGETFAPGEIEALRAKSGIPAIFKNYQPMDTSSSRVRDNGHWWTVPMDIFMMARAFNYWQVHKASRVDRLTSQSRRWVAAVFGLLGPMFAGFVLTALLPAWTVLGWGIPQAFKLLSLGAPRNARIDSESVEAYTFDQRVHEMSHLLVRWVPSKILNEFVVEVIVFPLAFWAIVLSGLVGMIQARRGPMSYRSHPARRVGLAEKRAAVLNEFVSSGSAKLQDFAELAPAAVARMKSPAISQLFGYLAAIKDRERQERYARARALLASA
jgi:hypothetical protein